jgi:hypothetical protein
MPSRDRAFPALQQAKEKTTWAFSLPPTKCKHSRFWFSIPAIMLVLLHLPETHQTCRLE